MIFILTVIQEDMSDEADMTSASPRVLSGRLRSNFSNLAWKHIVFWNYGINACLFNHSNYTWIIVINTLLHYRFREWYLKGVFGRVLCCWFFLSKRGYILTGYLLYLIWTNILIEFYWVMFHYSKHWQHPHNLWVIIIFSRNSIKLVGHVQ